jgi:hypothetical protein
MAIEAHMTDEELRELVRESIARHLRGDMASVLPGRAVENHASHAVFQVVRGSDGDGACLIEPTVRCNHCSYCQSYGH